MGESSLTFFLLFKVMIERAKMESAKHAARFGILNQVVMLDQLVVDFAAVKLEARIADAQLNQWCTAT